MKTLTFDAAGAAMKAVIFLQNAEFNQPPGEARDELSRFINEVTALVDRTMAEAPK